MKRQQILTVMLASIEGRSLTPAQLQKAMFLISRNIPDVFSLSEKYNFQPYDYGPFDKSVYEDAVTLVKERLAKISPSGVGPWPVYAASIEGVAEGKEIRKDFDPEHAQYIASVAEWVESKSFSSLVKSIYEAYPEMKANSIFEG